jgi:GT2 family glycosyltransferase
MDLSIIILMWNSAQYVESCLNTLIASLSTTPCRYEILIVDNGSTDDTPSLLGQFAALMPGRIDITYMPTNVGTTKSRNMALAKAKGTYICIMDSDVEAQPFLFASLVAVLDGDPTAGMVVPAIAYPNGTMQKSWDRFPTLPHKINRFFNLKKMEQTDAEQMQMPTTTMEVDYAISAFWLFRRELLDKVGFLDEQIFYAPEDVDYCLRIWKSGYRIMFVPTVQVVHYTQEISRGWRLNRAKFSHLKGLVYLFAKHGYLFQTPNLRPINIPEPGAAR